MFGFLVMIAFFWVLIKTVVLAFKLAWGAAKIVANILMACALVLLVVFLLNRSGIALCIPVLLQCAAFGVLKICKS